eukprot:scaffold609_cov170-Amphora_coffeaeformis.AAC.40
MDGGGTVFVRNVKRITPSSLSFSVCPLPTPAAEVFEPFPNNVLRRLFWRVVGMSFVSNKHNFFKSTEVEVSDSHSLRFAPGGQFSNKNYKM